jgi:DNA-binding MarR family transcriptional regulator
VDRDDENVLRRIGVAWRETRRSATVPELRRLLHGGGGSEAPLEPAQVDALDVLVSRPGQRMSEMAQAMRIDASTATRAVERLEAAGLAERLPAGDDRRAVVANATAAGRRMHERLVEGRLATLRAVLADFSPEERETLANLLERLVTGIDAVVERERAASRREGRESTGD